MPPEHEADTASYIVDDQIEFEDLKLEGSNKYLILRPGLGGLRAVKLEAAKYPGIPLDLAGLRYADRHGEEFNKYASIQLDFSAEEVSNYHLAASMPL